MLVDELRELTNNSKQYQEEYEEIVRKLREIAAGGLNEMKVMGGISNAVKDRLRNEGLTITYKCNLEVRGVKFDEEEDMLQLEFYRNRISNLEKSMAAQKKENDERIMLQILMRKYGIIPQPQDCPF